jgi:prepilin-type processing-associated H-X9-DG protein
MSASTHAPSQVEPLPLTIMIAGSGFEGVKVASSYAYNEGLLGYEDWSPHRRRGDLRAANPASEIVFMTDGLPRTEMALGYAAWYTTPQGRCTLADCYTNVNGSYAAGVASQFDLFRHPRFRINIVFCDGHVESLVITQRDLERAVLLAD